MSFRRGHKPTLSEAPLGLILVDYDNLFNLLEAHTSKGEQPHRFLVAMQAELRRYLQDELSIRATRSIAFGDFTDHGIDAGVILTDLADSGIEPRHVPASRDRTDAEVDLTLRAAELLHTHRDIGAFVILSGNHWYLPLVRHLHGSGKFVLVASLELPPQVTGLPSGISDAYLNARFLLDARSRESIRDSRPASREPEGGQEGQPSESAQSRAPEVTVPIEDPGALHALEILEEYFGQYEEVYLTPLLRKLTEALDPEDGEPKDAVSILQESGAVWLEKRRGFPYDYTVLLVNGDHPDVQQVRESFADGADGASDGYEDDFEDEYDDEGEEGEEGDDRR